jgi:enoyl-CoA hydratase
VTAQRILTEDLGEGVVQLTLNRPEKMNALDLQMVEALHGALEALERAASLRAIVLTGAGERAFVAGADIAQLKARGALDALSGINTRLFRRVETFPVPVIAAVRGYALGGGCELALACDLRVGGPSTRFAQPEADLGIIPAAGATQRLPRIVGLGRAKELVLLGDRIHGEEAHRLGILNRYVEDDEEILPTAHRLAHRIAQRGPLAIRMAKLTLNASVGIDADTGMMIESLAQATCFESEDKHARMQAFLDRKK